MAITIQNYEWNLTGRGDFIPYLASDYPQAGNDLSIFVGGFGNNIEIPPFVMETQFVVIEQFGSKPGVLCQTNLTNSLSYTTGTITSVGTAVTGIGTAFTVDMLGGTITSNGGQVRNIVAFTNATSITIDVAFAPDIGVADNFVISYGVGLTTTKPRTYSEGNCTSAATTVTATGLTGAGFTADMIGGTISITDVSGNIFLRNITARPTPTTLTIDAVLNVPGVSLYVINYTVSEIDLTSWIPNGFVQIVVNTTGYYQDPQNTWQNGISGDASPYPASLADVPKSYELKPSIYILPEQTWDFRYTMMNDLSGYVAARAAYTPSLSTVIPASTNLARCQVQYYLFDGPDSLICHQLLELGIPINVENVEWYKKMLLKERGLDTDTWEHYLEVSVAYRDREKKYDELYGRTRKG
jgi:hypothetical protein